MKFYNILVFVGFCIISAAVGNSVFAAQEVVSKECGMRVEFPQSIEDKILLRKIDGLLVNSFFPSRESMERLSKVCEIALADETKYNIDMRGTIFIEHDRTEFRPRVYTWNEVEHIWEPYESIMNRKTLIVTSEIPLKKQYVAVFADKNSEYTGFASWYSHKRYPAGSATNIFPIGTKLRVTNSDTGKDTFVTVTSTWTNKDKRRVIDLVRTAFEKIGDPATGLIPVIIERIVSS